jgi:type III pantothenate kinase
MMDLMIDIGNTHTVAGIYNKNRLYKIWRLSSEVNKTDDEYWTLLRAFFNNEKIDLKKIEGACISSVVPDLNFSFKRMILKYLKIDPLFIHSDLDLGLKILYEYPSAVGADRLCNSVAGKVKYGSPLIIIDFGTATTFDCIDRDGNYLGGIICPGLESTSEILHQRAAKLPKVDLIFPENVIGHNTEESIQSGIMYGAVEMLEGLIKRVRNILGDHAKVIATGGLAYLITKNTKSIEYVEENLNIEGIYIIYKRNRQ